MIIIFFSTVTYLIIKRFIYRTCLEIEDSIAIFPRNDYETELEVFEDSGVVNRSE
jgi:hypothetical protein